MQPTPKVALITGVTDQGHALQVRNSRIPMGEVHRLHNPGKLELEVIEVQSGSYLGEDDIVRLEDSYGRTEPARKA